MTEQNNKINKDTSDSLNNLPEYVVRTMKDDLGKKPPQPPEELPIIKPEPVIKPEPETKPQPEIKKASLPTIEEFISSKPIIPPAPTPPPKIIVAEKEIEKKIKKEKPPKPLKIKKRTLIILIIILVIIGLGGFFYWQGIKPETPAPTPTPSGPEIPEPLIKVDETKTLFLQNTSLLTLLKAEAKLDQTLQTFKRIVPIKGEKEILSLSSLIQELRIAVYPYAFSELKDSYTLVLYSQDGEKRIGLIIETTNPVKLKEQMNLWEKTMPDDLKNLFLDEKLAAPTTQNFKDNTYENVAIRYINFPQPDLTIDYAISDNLLLLSTSKETMYKIIDRIKL